MKIKMLLIALVASLVFTGCSIGKSKQEKEDEQAFIDQSKYVFENFNYVLDEFDKTMDVQNGLTIAEFDDKMSVIMDTLDSLAEKASILKDIKSMGDAKQNLYNSVDYLRKAIMLLYIYIDQGNKDDLQQAVDLVKESKSKRDLFAKEMDEKIK